MNKSSLQCLFNANYYEQIIDEACNADMAYNNHFRRTMTIHDCIESVEKQEVWKRAAKV